MAVSQKVLNEKLREKFLEIVGEILKEKDEEVLRTGSNEIAVPCLDEEGNEKFVVLTIKVPTGSRDGDAYDGYAMAEEFEIKQKLKAEKAKETAEKKAKKIERDKKLREQKRKETGEELNFFPFFVFYSLQCFSVRNCPGREVSPD